MESHHREPILGELYEPTLNLLIVVLSTTHQKTGKLIRSFEATEESEVTEYFLRCTPGSPVRQLISICSDYFLYWWSLGAVHSMSEEQPRSPHLSQLLRA